MGYTLEYDSQVYSQLLPLPRKGGSKFNTIVNPNVDQPPNNQQIYNELKSSYPSWFYKFITSEPATAALSIEENTTDCIFDATRDDLVPVGHLDDSNLVGNIKGIVVRRQTHISLLVPSGSHQCVHLGELSFVCCLL